ncbi:MAG TPA: hypothetical protein VKC51_03880 [Lacunisphaera sp.]|nr:hypothetical protein [Lacunisphaera sp.]
MAAFGDKYFTIPAPNEDGPDPEPEELPLAFSLTGAVRGEIVPCATAEIVTPRSQQELRLPGAIFKRVRITHKWRTAYTTEQEVIDAWQRV